MRLAAALTALGCLGVAAFADSTASLTPLLLIAGAGNALGGPSVSALLRREVEIQRQGLAFGAQQSGASLGALLAGLSLPALAIPFGWRWAFVASAVLALAAAALAPAVTERGPPRSGRGPRGGLTIGARAGARRRAGQRGGRGLRGLPRLYAVDSGIGEGAAGLLLGAVSLARPRSAGSGSASLLDRRRPGAADAGGGDARPSASPATCC